MSNSTAQFVSVNFAEFLLDSANNGNEILAVLDDIAEGADTALINTYSTVLHRVINNIVENV